MNKNEIRIRYTGKAAYYVLGDECRAGLLAVIDHLQETVIPKKWNKYDQDALDTMGDWLADDRDFSDRQWAKFGKMLLKFGLPDSITDFADQAGWKIGRKLDKKEMYEIMEERREKKRVAKMKAELKGKWVNTAAEIFDTTFGDLFIMENRGR